jgi:hypothetical protein
MTVADRILEFYRSLSLDVRLPKGIAVLNPYRNDDVFRLTTAFYKKYYDDNHTRTIILGINPGRYGAGLTGIPFTDPVQLQNICGIANDLDKRPELSATFVYQLIHAYGGAEAFFRDYFIGALSPLGFTKDGKNINYYDHPNLVKAVAPFMIKGMHDQLTLNIGTANAFCLGEGKNARYLTDLNAHHHFFDAIVPLPHPRYIMQYKRRQLERYIRMYLTALRQP